MSELRAPDPTLTAHYETRHEGNWTANWVKVGVDFRAFRETGKFGPPIAHRLTAEDAAACGATGDAAARNESTFAWRWVAVPCRECFPESPPPGWHPSAKWVGNPDPNLAWQVNADA